MSFPYKTALVLGATSGIGLELANRLVSRGVYTIAVGRRQERLDAFVKQHGPSKAAGYAFDIEKFDTAGPFAATVTKNHPDLDCIFLNAGVQHVMHIGKPETISIAKIQQEINVNYIGMIAVTNAFLPFFQKKPTGSESAFIYTTTSLETIPYPMVFSYSASKAALRSYILSAREMIKEVGGPKINLVELYTPVVQTELHDHQPGWGPGRETGMPCSDFVTAAMKGFEAKDETVIVGDPQKAMWDEFEAKRNERTAPFWAMVKKFNPGVHEL
ncbi:hypothetical protein FH972_021205 [Carpinus fangiana]|uniref:NAD(P)-binding protein n=1 Tax=Carpinus fangiana TaxID=176857 RepID=A0A5N6KNN9_9ROSI|nr:hypothetical protein FH972_021205 [Carpinus fangiana]